MIKPAELIRTKLKISQNLNLPCFLERAFSGGFTVALLSWAIALRTPPASAVTLEYLNSFVMDTTAKVANTQVGGLSGLAYRDGLFWAVSDDKGTFGELRVYGIKVLLTDNEFSASPVKTIFLKDEKGKPFSQRSLDLEGLVSLSQSFLISSEGLLDHKPRAMPALLEFDFEGKMLKEIKIPEAFLPERTGKQKNGVRSNGAFEGLSLSPSGASLWMITEQPLMQDQKKWKQGEPGYTRLLRFKKVSNQWQFDREWQYPIEPVVGSGKGAIVFGQGVSEILAINDSDLLVMERNVSSTGTEVNYDIRLFKISIEDSKVYQSIHPQKPSKKPEDREAMASISEPTNLVKKELVFDFASIKSKIPDGKGLDNFEAIAWGPELRGQKTLLIVSDDNFTSLQRTVWVALKIIP